MIQPCICSTVKLDDAMDCAQYPFTSLSQGWATNSYKEDTHIGCADNSRTELLFMFTFTLWI